MTDRQKRFYVKLGANLRKARKRKGLTLTEVATLTNRGVSTVSENERGFTEIPFSVIMEYCKIYEVNIEDITPKY